MLKELTLEKLKIIYTNMLENGYDMKDFIHNIILNYSTFIDDNEKIFMHKRKISECLNVDFKNIFLIGSRHLGIKLENKIFINRELNSTVDYDYAIVDSKLFSKFFDEFPPLKNSDLSKDAQTYRNYILEGFLHPKYNINLKKNLKSLLTKEEKISICIYLSEKSLINRQYSYYKDLFVRDMAELADFKNIGGLSNGKKY